VEGFKQLRRVRRPEEQDNLLRLHVNPKWDRLKCEDITPHMVEALLASATRKDSRPGPLNDGSKEQILNVIRQVLDYAVEERAIPPTPLARSTRSAGRGRGSSQSESWAPTNRPDSWPTVVAFRGCGRSSWLRCCRLSVSERF
jgi:hypothetical protein